MTTIKNYIKNILKNKLPNLDISDGSPLSELFVSPLTALLDPVLTQLKYLLDNLGLLEPEKINPLELDAIAANFLIYRRQAIAATGYVEMYFDAPQNILIPKNTIFVSNDARQYIITSAFQVTYSAMQENLWKFPLFSTGLIPVTALVDNIGTPLAPGSIVSTDFSPAPIQVTNPTAFTEGTVAETNTELAQRLIDSVMNKSLASEQSYTNLITENFPSVREVITIGAGDSRMIRDLHYSGIESLENYHLTDYFGKISISDFYISASGGYYVKTSGIFDSVPGYDEYPYPQSKAYWTLFYDDPTSSGLISDMPNPEDFVVQFSTSQYANLYYLKDSLKTTLATPVLLQDAFVGSVLDPRWVLGDVFTGATTLKNAVEITSTNDGVRLGYTPDPAVLTQTPVNVSKDFLQLVKDLLYTSLLLESSYATLIDWNRMMADLRGGF
jgi:hypothetical protein